MNARELIGWSLRAAGIAAEDQAPSFQTVNDALVHLNAMIGQWSKKRWLVYHLHDLSITASGKQSYTIGPGGDFDYLAPDRIETAYVRLGNNSPQPIDYQIKVMDAYEDYVRIAAKSLNSFPTQLFYDTDWPTGKIYVWPIPNQPIELHIVVKHVLNGFPTLDAQIDLPPEYMEALMWNLVGRLCLMFKLPVDPPVAALAQETLNAIRSANIQVPQMQLDPNLPGMPRGVGTDVSNTVGGRITGIFTLDEDELLG